MKTTRREFVGTAAAAFAAVETNNTETAAGGQSDDAENLQKTLDNDHLLDLRPGTYRLTKPLVLNMKLTGYVGIRGPRGTARLVMAGAGPAIQVVGDHQGAGEPKSVKAHTWERERFPMLSGFEIVGEHPEAEGIVLLGTLQATVEGVSVRRCRNGIRLSGCNQNVTIANCHLYDNSDAGIFLDSGSVRQLNITGNHIGCNKRAGIRQLNGDAQNVQITGNDIECNAGADASCGDILLESPEAGTIGAYTICGNTIQGNPGDAGANVAVLRGEKSGQVGSIAITGNMFGGRKLNLIARNARGGMTISGNTMQVGMDGNVVLERCSNVLVSGNVIRPAAERDAKSPERGGVRLADCEGCAVSDNIIVTRAGKEPSTGSITLLGCRAVSASSNQVLEVQRRGVYLQDCVHCRVVGNTLMPVENCPEFIAVAAEGVCEGNIIRDNFPCGRTQHGSAES